MPRLAIAEQIDLSACRASAIQSDPLHERRARRRYPLHLQVRYRTRIAKLHSDGIGWTVNISSTGLMIASRSSLAPGSKVELRIAWPSDLDGSVPLQLVAIGEVVRSEEDRFAVVLGSHEFHTLKSTRNGTQR